jgi:putative hydrolases of HD superfamily
VIRAEANDAILDFWSLALRLKRLRRTGWLDRGVADPESGADHSWGVAFLAWLLARDRPELDRERVLLIGLVHDLPEAVAGDPTPFDHVRDPTGVIASHHFTTAPGYTKSAQLAKQQAEQAALDDMLRDLPTALAGDIRTAWQEYEQGETPEARCVRQIDKLETLLQAEDYHDRQPELAIESFRIGARRDVSEPDLLALLEVRLRRPPE